MKKVFFLWVVIQFSCHNVFCQENLLEKDSLPVYLMKNEFISAVMDSFSDYAQKEITYPSVAYFLYLDLYDDGGCFFVLDLRKSTPSDSVVLYRDPNSMQGFILHRNILFEAYFRSYFDKENYARLPEIVKKIPLRKEVYFKEPPPGYYDTTSKGDDVKYEDMLLMCGGTYFDGEWTDDGWTFFYQEND